MKINHCRLEQKIERKKRRFSGHFKTAFNILMKLHGISREKIKLQDKGEPCYTQQQQIKAGAGFYQSF